MNSISHLLFGKISFIATDGFVNIFLENCRKNNIILYDIKTADGGISGWIQKPYTDKLFDAAEKSGMNIHIVSRYGLPSIYVKYRKRFGIPAGLILFIFIIALMNSMIWTIEIKGNNIIDEFSLISVIEDTGLKTGAVAEKINAKDIEFRLYKTFPEIAWVNVQIIGSRAFITISESENTEKLKEDIYSNILASKDGEVVLAEILNGSGEIYPGTAVVKGDLLVSGVKTYRDGRVEFVDSEAIIYAKTKNYIEAPLPDEIPVKSKTVSKNSYILSFFNADIPLSFSKKKSDFTVNKYYFSLFPIGIRRTYYYTLEEQIIQLNHNEKLLISLRDFSMSALKLYENCEIIESSISVPENLSGAIEGNFVCVEDIALKKTFTVVDENLPR